MPKMDYSLLKERALANFETLLLLWDVDFVKATETEYDFLSPTRHNDKTFGACRFNIRKGIGSDFAGLSYSKAQYEQVGLGFSAKDFAGFSEYGESNPSFDIIGLCQRIHSYDTYSKAAERLEQDLNSIDGGKVDIAKLAEQVAIRHEQLKLQKEKMRNISERIWSKCKDVKGTIGEVYLNTRGIELSEVEPNMKFHYKIFNKELNCYIPALIFRVSKNPTSALEAVHRVWIALDGTRKARLEEAKKAIGSIEGNGIWLGSPCEKLYIAEGPENALDLRFRGGCKFVVCSVYSTNFHSLEIPECVKTVVLVPDVDTAGIHAAVKASRAYAAQGKEVRVIDLRKLQRT